MIPLKHSQEAVGKESTKASTQKKNGNTFDQILLSNFKEKGIKAVRSSETADVCHFLIKTKQFEKT